MEWRKLLRLRRREVVSLERVVTAGQREATAAVKRARQDHAEAQARRAQMAVEIERLQQLRAQNHFAERMRTALQGGH
jgi:hypothetical protein